MLCGWDMSEILFTTPIAIHVSLYHVYKFITNISSLNWPLVIIIQHDLIENTQHQTY